MDERPEIWLLARGEEPVAELLVEQRDRPWVRGRVVPWEGFGPLRQLFDRERRLAAQMDEVPDAWARAHQELRREVRLIGPDGREVPNFLLHIDGRRARWRSGDLRSGDWLADQMRITGPTGSRPRSRRRALTAAAVLMLVL